MRCRNVIRSAAAVAAAVVLAAATPAPRPALFGFRAEPSETTERDAAFEAEARREAAAALGLRDAQVAANRGPASEPACARGERGLVSMDYTISPWTSSNGTFRRSAIVALRLVGCGGTYPNVHFPVGSGVGEESSSAASATAEQNEKLLRNALAPAVAAFRASAASNAGFVANLTRCGLALGDTERTAFLAIRSDRKGGVVARVDPIGTAARAGLQAGDRVFTINGAEVTGANVSTLMIAADKTGRWEVTGSRNVSFDAQNAQWYAAHGGCAP
jgi:PDZ domain